LLKTIYLFSQKSSNKILAPNLLNNLFSSYSHFLPFSSYHHMLESLFSIGHFFCARDDANEYRPKVDEQNGA